MEFPYIPVVVPAKSGGFKQVDTAAVKVRTRRGDCVTHSTGALVFQGSGILDSGAATPVVPLRLAHKLGVPISEESGQTMYSVSGKFKAYVVDIGMDM